MRDSRDVSASTGARRARAPYAPSEIVLALQRDAGNAAVVGLLRRPVEDAKGNVTAIEFTVGTEISAELAKLAKSLVADGVNAKELGMLRDKALADQTVDDNERMFVAGLLDPANAKLVATTNMKRGAKVSFSRASIQANVVQVKDLGKQKADPAADEEKQIKKLATSTWATQATDLVAFGKKRKLALKDVLAAMLAAGSDHTPGDMVMAGTVYAIAAAAKHALAPDLLAGRLKVDQLAGKDGINADEFAKYYALGSGTFKGDTLYVPAGLKIADLEHRSQIMHELQHAAEDKAAPAKGKLTEVPRDEAEVRGYRAAARYLVDEIGGLTGSERTDAIKLVAKRLNPIALLALMLESRDKKLVAEIRNAAAKKPEVRLPDKRFAELEAGGASAIRAELSNIISSVYGIVDEASNKGYFDAFSGESLLDWSDRPLP